MSFEATRVLLKGGRSCVFRAAAPDDMAAIFELERAVARVGAGVERFEDELPRDLAIYAAQRAGMAPKEADGSGLWLVAEEEGRGLLAEGFIWRFRHRMARHRVTMAINVHPDAQGIGIGRALFAALFGWAEEHRDPDGGRVSRFEVIVRADNERCLAMVRPFQLELEGRLKSYYRLGDGTFVDALVLARFLGDARGLPVSA